MVEPNKILITLVDLNDLNCVLTMYLEKMIHFAINELQIELEGDQIQKLGQYVFYEKRDEVVKFGVKIECIIYKDKITEEFTASDINAGDITSSKNVVKINLPKASVVLMQYLRENFSFEEKEEHKNMIDEIMLEVANEWGKITEESKPMTEENCSKTDTIQ